MARHGRTAAAVISLASGLYGCASECPGEPPAGSYLAQFTRRSGDCVEYTEAVIVYDDAPTVPDPDCVDNAPSEVDACGEESDQTCLVRDDLGDVVGEQRSIVRFDYTGAGAAGLATIVYDIYGGTDSDCQSTYDVSVTAL